MIPRIAITIGDWNGIGPEIALKALSRREITENYRCILIGPIRIFEYYKKKLNIRIHLEDVKSIPSKKTKFLPVLSIPEFEDFIPTPGTSTPEAGRCAGKAIELCASYCLDWSVDAMVTAPVSKKELQAGGYHYPGQTEMIAAFSGNQRPVMMLTASGMRVSLVTIHIPISEIKNAVTIDKIFETTVITDNALRYDFGIRKPTIAILSLNPHASENGLIGDDDLRIVTPAVELLRRHGLDVHGPFPADGFFAHWHPNKYDAVIAQFHDQGLIPLKMIASGTGVNFTAGLSIIRTSPDHGTAFDIAGKGTAEIGSMISAIQLAGSIAKHRKKIVRDKLEKQK